MLRWSGPFSPLFIMATTPEQRETTSSEPTSRRGFLKQVGTGTVAAAAASTLGNTGTAAEGKEAKEGLQTTWTVEEPTLVAKYKGQPVDDRIQPKADVQPKAITISCRGMAIANEACPNGGEVSGTWNHKHVAGNPDKSFAEHLVIGIRTNGVRQNGEDHWPHELDEALSIKLKANDGQVSVHQYQGAGGKRDLGNKIGEVGDVPMKAETDIKWKVVDANGQLDVYVHDMAKPVLTLTAEKDKLPERPEGAENNKVVVHDREASGAINESTLTDVKVVPAAA
jgi:hypothetical protein